MLHACDKTFFLFFWFNVIIFTSFNLRITLFSHKNYTFRTTNIARSIIKLTLKNKQICTRTYDFLIKTLSMSFKLKTKKIDSWKKKILNFFFFFFFWESMKCLLFKKKSGPCWSCLVQFGSLWSTLVLFSPYWYKLHISRFSFSWFIKSYQCLHLIQNPSITINSTPQNILC